MGKLKAVALAHAPHTVAKAEDYDPTDSMPAKQLRRAPKASKPNPHRATPTHYTYALKQYTCERRINGWWICHTPFGTAGANPTEWAGPFETIETACLAIARRLATEVADRHTRTIEAHKIAPVDPLYGLKPTTRINPEDGSSTL